MELVEQLHAIGLHADSVFASVLDASTGKLLWAAAFFLVDDFAHVAFCAAYAFLCNIVRMCHIELR